MSFDKDSYTVQEGNAVEVCFSTNMGHSQSIEVVIMPTEKDVTNPAQGSKNQTKLELIFFQIKFNNNVTIIISPFFEFIGFNDFDSDPITEVFAASSTSSTLCVNISTIRDDVYDKDEQFLVKFGNLPNVDDGVFVGQINQTCVTILDQNG